MTRALSAGTLVLREILLPAGALEWCTDPPRFALLFDKGPIRDWNVCDWFCVKALGPLVEQQGEGCARAISEWRGADGGWRRRASVVVFADLAGKGDDNFPGFTEMVLENCSHLLPLARSRRAPPWGVPPERWPRSPAKMSTPSWAWPSTGTIAPQPTVEHGVGLGGATLTPYAPGTSL